jgi:hypothetical protein
MKKDGFFYIMDRGMSNHQIEYDPNDCEGDVKKYSYAYQMKDDATDIVVFLLFDKI